MQIFLTKLTSVDENYNDDRVLDSPATTHHMVNIILVHFQIFIDDVTSSLKNHTH